MAVRSRRRNSRRLVTGGGLAPAHTVPGAPTGVVAAAGDSQVLLEWNAPGNTGGVPLTGYEITPYIGAAAQTPILTGSTGIIYTVTGLTNGTTYAFTVAAINSVGVGPFSAISNSVTPSVGLQSVVPSGITSAQAFGTAIVGRGAVSLLPAGIGSVQAFGTPVIALPGSQNLVPTGIVSAQAIGIATVGRGAVNLSLSGIASAEAFGTAAIANAALPQMNLTQVASDNFNRANATLAGANNWLATSEGSMSVSSSEATGAAGTGRGNYRTSETYNSNQYSQCTVGSVALASGQYYGLSVRNQDNQNNYTGIYFLTGGTYQLILYKKAAGSFAQIAINTLGGALSAGTVLTMTAEGSVINFGTGTAGVTAFDTTFTGGVPGIESFGTATLDNWAGGNAATGAVSAATASDNFNRANGNVSVGSSGAWVLGNYAASPATVEIPIASNQLSVGSGITGHAADVRTDTYNSNHWSALQMGATPPNSAGFVGPTVRNQGSGATLGNAGYLGVQFHNSAYAIYSFTGSSSTFLAGTGTGGNDPAGTEYKLVANGSRISLRVHPVGGVESEVLAVTDSTYSGGVPGMMMFATSTGDNWSGGNV